MAKSIKLKNNMYWDSTSITHNKEKLSDKLNNLEHKTTEETFTGKYWIDGKKIYRKVITGTFGEGDKAHGITNPKFHILQGNYTNSNGITFVIPALRTAYTEYQVSFYASATTISFEMELMMTGLMN